MSSLPTAGSATVTLTVTWAGNEAISNRVINGDYGLAIAYCAVLIVLMMTAIGLINLVVGRRRLGRRAAVAPAALSAGGRA
jgi:iron(III) transport system permease protein